MNRRQLMIVDDEPEVLSAISDVINEIGYDTLTACDGEDALQKLSGNLPRKPQAVLCDIMMPNMSGLDFLSRIRALGNDIPFVFLTGSDSSSKILTAVRLGAIDFLKKPFDHEELKLVVERALDIGVRQERMKSLVEKAAKENPQLATELDAVGAEIKYVERLRALNSRARE